MVDESMNQIVQARIEKPIEVGKFCHQCRQRRVDVVGTCMTKKRTRSCAVKLCPKCLWNRYGENAEEVGLKDDWYCPKCRGICNCSICMKKQGKEPTGILVRTAKENGCSNASEFLVKKGSCSNAQQEDAVGEENSAEENHSKRQELKSFSAGYSQENAARTNIPVLEDSTESITVLEDSTFWESSSSLHKNLVSSKDVTHDVESSRYVAHNDVIQHPHVMTSYGYYRPSGILKVKGENVSLPSYGYNKPSGYLKVKGEHVAITAVKRQLGRQYREDGPPLGVEFDPLPPGVFEIQTNAAVQAEP